MSRILPWGMPQAVSASSQKSVGFWTNDAVSSAASVSRFAHAGGVGAVALVEGQLRSPDHLVAKAGELPVIADRKHEMPILRRKRLIGHHRRVRIAIAARRNAGDEILRSTR